MQKPSIILTTPNNHNKQIKPRRRWADFSIVGVGEQNCILKKFNNLGNFRDKRWLKITPIKTGFGCKTSPVSLAVFADKQIFAYPINA